MAKRLMAVHAHPDDESSKGAATYARYVREGVEVMVVSCTGGERGDVLNELVLRNPKSERDIAGLRREEMEAAQRILGFEHRWLGYYDSGMASEDGSVPEGSFASIPVEISAEVLVHLVREFKPHVMVTYNEIGGYPHPDHIRCHEISVRAYEVAGDPNAYPEAGEPWQVSKLYYDEIFNAGKVSAIKNVLVEKYPDSPLHEHIDGMTEWMRDRPYTATTRVDVSDYLEARDDALRAHASQVAPDSGWFFLPNDLVREAWPYEDYRLARSRVGEVPERPAAGQASDWVADPDHSKLETDLFQGIVTE